ncbi:serine/threonine-protein kinase/endoribonuclease IRE1a-like protein [Tanacetum coccineum]
MDNGKPKIGFPAFMTEDDEGCSQSANIKDLACLMLYYSTRGAYKFGVDMGPKELDKCKIPEVRDIIEWLMSDSPPTLQELLSHPWLWDTHKVTSFIIAFSDFIKRYSYASALVDRDFQSHKVFVAPWNGGTNGLDTNFVSERSNFISQKNGTPYDFNRGSSLVRIMRNGFNYHEEMSVGVKKAVGETKQEMERYFRTKYPNLVITLYRTGAWLTNASNLEIFYEGPKTGHY